MKINLKKILVSNPGANAAKIAYFAAGTICAVISGVYEIKTAMVEYKTALAKAGYNVDGIDEKIQEETPIIDIEEVSELDGD